MSGTFPAVKTSKRAQLTASFVVTVSALPALAGLGGCRKQTVENEPLSRERGTASVWRNGDRCSMMPPSGPCPKGVSCNPPPPTDIDCPPSHRDAGEPAPTEVRPPGKEGWLRTLPHLWVSQYGCSYSAEAYCAPPPKPFARTTSVGVPSVACKPLPVADGGSAPDASATELASKTTRWSLESFVFMDGLGTCHKVPAFVCDTTKNTDCIASMPAGEPVPCP